MGAINTPPPPIDPPHDSSVFGVSPLAASMPSARRSSPPTSSRGHHRHPETHPPLHHLDGKCPRSLASPVATPVSPPSTGAGVVCSAGEGSRGGTYCQVTLREMGASSLSLECTRRQSRRWLAVGPGKYPGAFVCASIFRSRLWPCKNRGLKPPQHPWGWLLTIPHIVR